MAKKTHNWLVDTLDIDYMIDSGLLFEINRTFLHPLGIALMVKVSEQGKEWSFKDYRNRPEELLLDAGTMEMGRQKIEAFLSTFGFGQMDRRRLKLGKSVQHAECWVK